MNVSIKLFGPQAQLVGRRELRIDLPGSAATIAQIRQALFSAEPKLQPSLPASRLAVNHDFATEEQTVREDDEIALIGLVSGG